MQGKSGNKLEKMPIGNVEQWLVNETKLVGLETGGFLHELTNEFITHITKRPIFQK